MSKDLTNSNLNRQNILNNELALNEIKKAASVKGVNFEGKITFTKEMLAMFYDVDIRTIERYMESFSDELKSNGYEILKGKRLKEFIKKINEDVPDMNVGNKTPQLSVFDFRAFLNIGMLLVESENARVLRQTILDIVIDTINQKTGGSTKYINQRDKAFIGAFLQEESYRREFTDALKEYVVEGNYKYARYTNMIYQSIFKENAKEYREVLKLKAKDKVRDTFYSDILNLVASYECGLAETIKQKCIEAGHLLSIWETDKIFKDFEELPHWKPLINNARMLMASRDIALRDAFHEQLKEYIVPLSSSEYNRFLGTESDEISKLMEENAEVLKRLKERE